MLKPSKPTSLIKGQTYEPVGVNYNQIIPIKGNHPYENSLLRISPYEKIKITVTSYPSSLEAEVKILKYNSYGKETSMFFGTVSLLDLKRIVGID